MVIIRSRIITFALTVTLPLILVAAVIVPLNMGKPDSTTPFYPQEANALTVGNYRVSAVITPLLQCQVVWQSGGQTLDGVVHLIINGTFLDSLDRENEMDVNLRYTAHSVDGTHMGLRVISLAVDMPVGSDHRFTLAADLPSHENTDHTDSVLLVFIPSSISGAEESQTIQFATTLPSCK